MTTINLKWSSASSRVNEALRRGADGADVTRRQQLPSPNTPARRHEKLGDSGRWEMAEDMSVSGSTPVFSPKPPQQQSRAEYFETEKHVCALQGSAVPRKTGSKDKDTRKKAHIRASTTEIGPRRKILSVTRVELTSERHRQKPRDIREPDSSGAITPTKGVTPIVMLGRGAKTDAGGASSVGFDLTARAPEQLLTRSGSAPSSSAMVLTSTSAKRKGLAANQTTEARASTFRERHKHTSDSGAELVTRRQDCWDESEKNPIPTDAAQSPPDGARSASNVNVTVLPVLSPGQEVSHDHAPKRKQRRARLHRTKSGVVDSALCKGTSPTNSTRSTTPRRGQGAAVAKRRFSTPEVSRPRTTSSSTSTAPDGVPCSRTVRRSSAPTVAAVDPGQLKARTRVLEWKRRRAAEEKEQHEEESMLEQKQQVDVDTASARKLAAARAEEVRRRCSSERENTADALRTQEMAERWAKNSRQKDRRRAEIYAINAVMRAAFEKEFETYSAEQEQRAKQST
ncbi:unnamed protein product, partial [Scytosiphon promiscuus]